MNFEIISGKTLREKMERPDCLLLDIRSRERFAAGHIDGAWQMDPDSSAQMLPSLIHRFIRLYGREPDCVILYCDTGYTSLLLAEALAQKGYAVASLNGGYERYKNHHQAHQSGY